jgi:hypothetical protein
MRDRERVKKAAEYCNDVLTDGWEKAVAEHATKYVTTDLEESFPIP